MEKFDFNTLGELEEHQDYTNLLPCPHCKKPIPQDATLCLYCGQDVDRAGTGRGKPWWVPLVAAILIIMLLAYLF